MIKKTIFVLLSIIILTVLAFYMLTGSVDHTPYFKKAYYEITRSRLDSAMQILSPSKGALNVGFARINITPIIGAERDDPTSGTFKVVPLAGYGSREGRPATGVHDSLFVKVIALKVDEQLVVFVGSDLLIMPPEITITLNKQLKNIKREQLFLSATHTHSSLGAWASGWVGSQFAGEENPSVRQWLTIKIKTAILSAIEDLQPARMATANFSAPEYVRNRLVGKLGRVNPEFTFVVFQQLTGKKCVLGAYAAHATTISASNMLFSAGYPGYWQNKLEKSVAHMAVFSAGTVGSHGPVGKGKDFERARYIGESLADSIIHHLPNLSYREIVPFSYVSCKVRLPEFHVRISMERHLCTALSRQLLPLGEDVWIQGLKISDLVWITSPCDFSGEYALDIKNNLRKRGYKSVISSFNGDYVGYVIPRKYYYLDKYESFTMAWFGPNLGDYFVDIIRRVSGAVM
jgi:hypothetical protein